MIRTARPASVFSVIAGLHRLRADRRANVLMIFAFALMPMTIAVGMTIDYARAARLQTKLNAVADAAALTAVSKPQMSQTALDTSARTISMFYNQADPTQGFVCNPTAGSYVTTTAMSYEGFDGTITVKITDTAGPQRTAQVTYTAQSSNVFAAVLGVKTLSIGGTATAKSSKDTYYQIVFVVDVSNSMGIGGTDADIKKMNDDKTIACAFACHDPNGTMGVAASSYCDGNPGDYFCHANGPTYCPYWGGCSTVNPSRTYSDRRGLAKRYGYKLKIDYVNDAVGAFITQLKPKMDATPQFYSVAIDTFGTGFAQIQTPTSSSTVLQAAAATIDTEIAAVKPGSGNQGWTYTSVGLDTALSNIINIGDGSSATSRKTFVVFISDGVEDIPGSVIYGRRGSLDYKSMCQKIKNAGATMFSIEAAYPVVPDLDGQYQVLVGNLPASDIPVTMKGCASSDDKYFYASDGPGIQAGVNGVFSAIFNPSRLTQ